MAVPFYMRLHLNSCSVYRGAHGVRPTRHGYSLVLARYVTTQFDWLARFHGKGHNPFNSVLPDPSVGLGLARETSDLVILANFGLHLAQVTDTKNWWCPGEQTAQFRQYCIPKYAFLGILKP